MKSAVCELTSRQCQEELGPRILAILLTGSLARDEVTYTARAGCWHILGDAEFMIILDESGPLPGRSVRQSLGKHIQAALVERGVRCSITIAIAQSGYLRSMRPHIFGYELRNCGQVIWGDPDILSLIPDFSPADIPLEDAWRLLCNRVIEWLELVPCQESFSAALSDDTLYRTTKLYLDMATSLLLFSDAYAPTYRERQLRLSALAKKANPEVWPFSLGHFAETVQFSTDWKLGIRGQPKHVGNEFWQEAIRYAHELWRWELARMTGAGSGSTDRELMMTWMRLQPLSQRARGWLYVLREMGWQIPLREWPHWVRRSWRASPRHWIYAAAAELAFRLPNESFQKSEALWAEVRDWLPDGSGQNAGPEPEWRALAKDIVRNYQDFLTETQA